MRPVLLAAAIAVCSIFVGGAEAITTNVSPGNGQHPNVGAIMVPARSGVGFAEVCSGPLVAPTIFLTASHCTAFLEADPGPDYVTFDETDIEPNPSGLMEATPMTNPADRGGGRDDVSVMVLKTPVTSIAPAEGSGAGRLPRHARAQQPHAAVAEDEPPRRERSSRASGSRTGARALRGVRPSGRACRPQPVVRGHSTG
jgi:hypothetical protein